MRLLPKNGLVSGDSGRHRRLRIFGDLRVRANSTDLEYHKVWSTFRMAGSQFPPNSQALARHSHGAMRTREYLLLVSI